MRLPPRLAFLAGVLRKTVTKWLDDDAFTLAAALSYYAIFSLAPVLVISISIAGLLFGWHEAETGIEEQLRQLIGDQGADVVRTVVTAAGRERHHDVLATVIGLGVLFFGASGVFVQLEKSLNQIWNVPLERRSGIVALVRQRFLSFAMVIGIGFILLMSLVLSAVLAATSGYLAANFPFWKAVGHGIDLLISLGLFTLLFAMIFKVLPDVELRWRHVWLGGGVSAALFAVGKWGIGIYLGHSNVASAFGAAGSLAVLLLWIFYGALIIFLGAEFTSVYTRALRERDGLAPDPERRRRRNDGASLDACAPRPCADPHHPKT
jgi:membrane protein